MRDTLDRESVSKRSIFPIKQRWTMLMAGMIAAMALSLFQIWDAMHLQELLKRVASGDEGAAYEIARIQQGGVTPLKALGFLVGVGSVVFVCMWVYRASQNVHEAGINYLNYTPGWNVGWFFIPLAHIVMPILALRETVKASQSLNQPEEYSSWQNNKPIGLFTLWSILYGLRMVLMYIVIFYMFSFIQEIARNNMSALLDMMEVQVIMAYTSIFFTLAESIVLILFTKKITDLQEQYRIS